jgi:hypothetical protein
MKHLDEFLAKFPPEVHLAVTREIAEQALALAEQMRAADKQARNEAMVAALRAAPRKKRGAPSKKLGNELMVLEDMEIAAWCGWAMVDVVRMRVAVEALVAKGHPSPAPYLVVSIFKNLRSYGTEETRKLKTKVRRRCELASRVQKKFLQKMD